MTNQSNREQLNKVLEALADEIAIPASKYREAKRHYEKLAKWLDHEESELVTFNPLFYPQGSIALGVANKPIGAEDSDVDCVCLLTIKRDQITQMQLKELVGNRLKHPKSPYKHMIDPKQGGRRCWTIRFTKSSKFHLDVLPAIPDDCASDIPGIPREWTETSILITDRKTWTDPRPVWPRSNPKGYIAWFKNRMRIRLDELKQLQATSRQASVEEIEDFEVRTPLQRLIQILKRHRDIRYNGDDDKPISILITTLAALAYDDEKDLVEALLHVVPKMRSLIRQKDGLWWVANPVNPSENFADKWNEVPRKASLFIEWLEAVEREFNQLLQSSDLPQLGKYLLTNFGHRDADVVIKKCNLAVVAPIVLVPPKTDRPATPITELPNRPSKPWRP